MDHFSEIWQAICDNIRQDCSDTNFKLWYSPLVLTDITDKFIFFTYPSTAKRDIFFNHQFKILKKSLESVLGYPIEVVILSLEELSTDSKDEQVQFCIDLLKSGKVSIEELNSANNKFIINLFSENNLLEPDEIVEPGYYDSLNSNEQIFDIQNPPKKYQMEYTFDNFVVGNSNKFAHAACISVANEPGKSYNPLFIYGPSGLGKTHLLYAISNQILKKNPRAIIIYVKSEEFLNQLIDSVSKNNTVAFKEKYRHCDVILVDDIQFIAGKKSVQEEFFHTFNALYEDKKQIIISSDKPPRDIPFLEDRLKSRFEWGLLADISCPDYETRLAILRKKAQEEKIVVDDNILANIANKIDSNIRELEGVFNKIIARASLTHSAITIELAENTINEFKAASEKVLSSDFIKDTVAKYFNINKDDLASNKRSNEIAFPRQIAMYLCREVANMSYPKIGEDFGNRDHSTVMHACKKIEKEVKDKNNTKLIVESVKNIIINGEQ